MTGPDDTPAADPAARPLSRRERRRQKMLAELARDRDGDHRVPTWALAVLLVVLIGGWLALVLLLG